MPAIELGRSIQRMIDVEPELTAAVDEARTLGDKEAEDLAFAELERRFLEAHAAVALSGTVDCWVDAEYGAIAVGDLLVTSPTPGHAMRSDPLTLGELSWHRPGTVLGKALEPLHTGRGEILVLLTLQ